MHAQTNQTHCLRPRGSLDLQSAGNKTKQNKTKTKIDFDYCFCFNHLISWKMKINKNYGACSKPWV